MVERSPVLLTLTHISKRFGNATALDDVSFRVLAGSAHALLGENGAGKTTLMRIAFGLLKPDEGSVAAGDPPQRVASAADAIRLGIGMVHQHFTNVEAMSVAENVALGGHGMFDAANAIRRVEEISARSGLALDPARRAGDLSVAGQQRLEIVKALARDARLLILDEPTAVLAPAEADDLLRWLRQFVNAGNAVVLITHKLNEALRLADEVTVLRRGRMALNKPRDEVSVGTLADAMLGEDRMAAASSEPLPTSAPQNRVIVRATSLTVSGENGVHAIVEARFELREREIVGIAAVEGAGQRELLRALARRTPVAGGELDLPTSVGFVPEDRHRDGSILSFSIAENIALRGAGDRRGVVSRRDQLEAAERLLQLYEVRGGDPATPMRALSGGNQQKVILGRELAAKPALLVVENPTRGLDIRAAEAVHNALRKAAETGSAVVVYSSDVDEVLALADRVLAVHGGVVRECRVNRDEVGRAMLGVTEEAHSMP
jgi:ABC-type uncharacterized transport system ATPase subunit